MGTPIFFFKKLPLFRDFGFSRKWHPPLVNTYIFYTPSREFFVRFSNSQLGKFTWKVRPFSVAILMGNLPPPSLGMEWMSIWFQTQWFCHNVACSTDLIFLVNTLILQNRLSFLLLLIIPWVKELDFPTAFKHILRIQS